MTPREAYLSFLLELELLARKIESCCTNPMLPVELEELLRRAPRPPSFPGPLHRNSDGPLVAYRCPDCSTIFLPWTDWMKDPVQSYEALRVGRWRAAPCSTCCQKRAAW